MDSDIQIGGSVDNTPVTQKQTPAVQIPQHVAPLQLLHHPEMRQSQPFQGRLFQKL
jgi:hypothetical protein